MHKLSTPPTTHLLSGYLTLAGGLRQAQGPRKGVRRERVPHPQAVEGGQASGLQRRPNDRRHRQVRAQEVRTRRQGEHVKCEVKPKTPVIQEARGCKNILEALHLGMERCLAK